LEEVDDIIVNHHMERLRCIPHTLQLVVKDMIKSCKAGPRLFVEASSICKYMKKSAWGPKLVAACGKTLLNSNDKLMTIV